MSYIVMKQKILFIMHMPPPVHGAAMVGQYIHDSKLINDKFDSHYINLTTAKILVRLESENWLILSCCFVESERV